MRHPSTKTEISDGRGCGDWWLSFDSIRTAREDGLGKTMTYIPSLTTTLCPIVSYVVSLALS